MALSNPHSDALRVGPLDRLPPAVFIMGPTGGGKTALALYLAARLPCTIISVDSALVYRGMDIGTAKPGKEVLARFPHRLIDIRDPAEPYSAARFREDALAAMREIRASERIPLLAGGTGLYFRALQHGLSELPSAAPRLRQRLHAEGERLGWPALHARLAGFDPGTATRIHPHDRQRIQRALEVYELSGRSVTDWVANETREPLPYRVVKLIVAPKDRTLLHQGLKRRFLGMLAAGLLREVEALHRREGLHAALPSMRTVGYRQIWQYLDGHIPWATSVERAIQATRQLAKRQLTWLRSERDGIWLDSTAPGLNGCSLRILDHRLARNGLDCTLGNL
ncbi:MAG: tRNA (adenosine(37)-N6)-dimethylallyltransferase MiaA [Gammaproteobacteria bacterium]